MCVYSFHVLRALLCCSNNAVLFIGFISKSRLLVLLGAPLKGSHWLFSELLEIHRIMFFKAKGLKLKKRKGEVHDSCEVVVSPLVWRRLSAQSYMLLYPFSTHLNSCPQPEIFFPSLQ